MPPPLLHLSESVKKCKWNLSEGFFCLFPWYLQSGDRPAYLFASLRSSEFMESIASGGQPSSSRVRGRFESLRLYDRRFIFQRHNGSVATIGFLSLRLAYLLRSWADFSRTCASLRLAHWWWETSSFAHKLGKIWGKEIILILFSLQISPRTLTLLILFP